MPASGTCNAPALPKGFALAGCGPELFRICLWILLAAAILPRPAWALPCDHFRRFSALLYNIHCAGGYASTKPAGASSTFSSSFNINSASLPTEPSGYGLEAIGSQVRTPSGDVGMTYSLVKGFRKFGAGLSTGSNNTFYGNDVGARLLGEPEVTTFEPREAPRGGWTNLNLGTSVRVYEIKNGPAFNLGLSARYNKTTDTWGGGPALLVSTGFLSFGAGFTRETVSNSLPLMTFSSYLVSARILAFEFQYDILNQSPVLNLMPIHILTATYTLRRLILTAAIREVNYVDSASGSGSAFINSTAQKHFAIQYLFSKRLAAGALFNYIPGASSLGLQVFL